MLVNSYVKEYGERVAAGMRDRLAVRAASAAIIGGRADLILGTENGEDRSLPIVDHQDLRRLGGWARTTRCGPPSRPKEFHETTTLRRKPSPST